MENTEASVSTLRSACRTVHPDNPKVCAIILTFNRLLSLQRCLAALERQIRPPNLVLVVDNHGSDGTTEYMESLIRNDPSLTVIRTPENSGSAGGFAVGMAWAVRKGYDYLWNMDDDCLPAPDCLDVLMRQMNGYQDTIVFPQNRDEFDHTSNYPSWRGVLIPGEVVKMAGVPREELFWGNEDTEYLQWRLPQKYGVKLVRASDATVSYSRFTAKKKDAWKFYYWGRNRVYYRIWVQGLTLVRFRKMVATIVKLWLRIVFWEDKKLKKSSYLLLGIYHGCRGRLGRVIDPVNS